MERLRIGEEPSFRGTLVIGKAQLAHNIIWLLHKFTAQTPMSDLVSLAFGTIPFGLTALRTDAVCRLMKTLEELLETVKSDLDPSIDYIDRLRSAGYRTPNSVKQADSAEQVQRACELLPGDANIIWKAAGGFAGKQLKLCGL